MTVGERLSQARTTRKYTQAQVADQLHVTRATISNWENGRSYPDIASLIRLSELYRLSLDTLLKENPSIVADAQKKEHERLVGRKILWANILITLVIAAVLVANLFAVTGFEMSVKIRWILLIIFVLNAMASGRVSYQKKRF